MTHSARPFCCCILRPRFFLIQRNSARERNDSETPNNNKKKTPKTQHELWLLPQTNEDWFLYMRPFLFVFFFCACPSLLRGFPFVSSGSSSGFFFWFFFVSFRPRVRVPGAAGEALIDVALSAKKTQPSTALATASSPVPSASIPKPSFH